MPTDHVIKNGNFLSNFFFTRCHININLVKTGMKRKKLIMA